MKLVDKSITIKELTKMSGDLGGFVKAVVDIKSKIMVVHGDLHSDEEQMLLEKGSKQDDLWGINLYPEMTGENFVEFDSVINLRPRLKNYSRSVEDTTLRKKIIEIVKKLVKR